MSKPFVVCHMLASLDGKIDGDFFGSTETGPARQAYGDLRPYYQCQATVYGTTTMLGGYADGTVSPEELQAPSSDFPERESFSNPALSRPDPFPSGSLRSGCPINLYCTEGCVSTDRT